MRTVLQLGIPMALIAWGVFFFRSYTRELAKEQKEFGERWRISRGISEQFHYYSAKVAAVAAITLGVSLLLWRVLSGR